MKWYCFIGCLGDLDPALQRSISMSVLIQPSAYWWRSRTTLTKNPIHKGPSCSATHVPGYINSPNLKSAGKVFVVSVNDPFVYVLPYPRLCPRPSEA